MSHLFVPMMALQALQSGADCAIGVSGGKDSQALLTTFVAWFREQHFSGRLFAIFADLGRAEWWQTRSVVEQLCARLGVELIVVHRDQGDLLDRFDQRQASVGPDQPFWPTTGLRYCSSDLKRTPCDKYLRNVCLIISLEGIRAQESEARAEKEPFTLRSTITGKRYRDLARDCAWALYLEDREKALRYQQLPLFGETPSERAALTTLPRLAFTWYPLFHWTLEDLWQACGTSLAERRQLYQEGTLRQDAAQRERALAGWPAHPAYVLGSKRLSCKLCGISPTLLGWFVGMDFTRLVINVV